MLAGDLGEAYSQFPQHTESGRNSESAWFRRIGRDVPIAEVELLHTTLSIKISGIVISSGYSKLIPASGNTC